MLTTKAITSGAEATHLQCRDDIDLMSTAKIENVTDGLAEIVHFN